MKCTVCELGCDIAEGRYGRCEKIDMEGLTREFYAKFYHIDLTDAQVQQLLNPLNLSFSTRF
jgi:hypothetical protein